MFHHVDEFLVCVGSVGSISNLLLFIMIEKDTHWVRYDIPWLVEGSVIHIHFVDCQQVLLIEPIKNVKSGPVDECHSTHINPRESNQISRFCQALAEHNIAIVISHEISIVGAPGVMDDKLCHIICSRWVSGCISWIDKLDIW